MENRTVFTNRIKSKTIAIHDSEPIRASFVALIIRIAIALLITDLTYTAMSFFFLKIYFLNLTLPFDLHHHVILILSVSHILKNLVQMYFLVIISLTWASRMYFIGQKQLFKRSGILSVTEQAYDLANIRSVIVHQSLIEKILHFGNVEIDTSASGGYMEKVTLREVADPQKYENRLLHTL